MPSPIVHFQIASPDPEATQAFLREVFGWEFGPGGGRIVANIDTGHRRVDPNDIYPSGTLLRARDGQPAYSAVFVRVADLDAAVDKAQALGARVIVPRSRTAAGTDVAIIEEPRGLVFGVVQL